MTDSKYPATIVALRDGLTVPDPRPAADPIVAAAGRVLMRGDVVDVTDAFVAVTRDRNGRTFLDDLTGDGRFAPGPLSAHPELAAEVAQREADAKAAQEAVRAARSNPHLAAVEEFRRLSGGSNAYRNQVSR